MMSQGQRSVFISHRRLSILRGLPVLRENIKGRGPWRRWALQAAGGPGRVWRLGHFPRPGV